MPTIEVQCDNEHVLFTDVQFLHDWAQEPDTFNKACPICGGPMNRAPSFGTPLLYFRENKPSYIANLDATIRSHGEHVRVMKEQGVEPATDWHSSKSRSDGLKTKAPPPHPKEKVLG